MPALAKFAPAFGTPRFGASGAMFDFQYPPARFAEVAFPFFVEGGENELSPADGSRRIKLAASIRKQVTSRFVDDMACHLFKRRFQQVFDLRSGLQVGGGGP